MRRTSATRLATGTERFLTRERPSVVNWVKSGTWHIILTHVGAVNQKEAVRFCARYTKNGSIFCPKGLSFPPLFRHIAKTENPKKSLLLLEKMQRKSGLFGEKTRVLPSKIPFYDINGNKFGDF